MFISPFVLIEYYKWKCCHKISMYRDVGKEGASPHRLEIKSVWQFVTFLRATSKKTLNGHDGCAHTPHLPPISCEGGVLWIVVLTSRNSVILTDCWCPSVPGSDAWDQGGSNTEGPRCTSRCWAATLIHCDRVSAPPRPIKLCLSPRM